MSATSAERLAEATKALRDVAARVAGTIEDAVADMRRDLACDLEDAVDAYDDAVAHVAEQLGRTQALVDGMAGVADEAPPSTKPSVVPTAAEAEAVGVTRVMPASSPYARPLVGCICPEPAYEQDPDCPSDHRLIPGGTPTAPTDPFAAGRASMKHYLLDGLPLEGSIDKFLADNGGLAGDAGAVRALKPGESYEGGGGAHATWTLTCVGES